MRVDGVAVTIEAEPVPIALAFEAIDPDAKGVVIQALNRWSSVGNALELGEDTVGYAVYEPNATAQVAGVTVSANYWTLQEGRLSRESANLTDDPLETARALGTIVVNPTELRTGAGNDRFMGGGEDSIVHSGAGNDMLIGKGGRDLLSGEDGRDTLIGGAGDDVLIGGAGADTFVFMKGDGHDVVRDFTAEDRLVLKGFFDDGQDLGAAIDHSGTTATVSNGIDTIVFENIEAGNLDWFHTGILAA